jgi:MYXO-CTERM domain-containing protein
MPDAGRPEGGTTRDACTPTSCEATFAECGMIPDQCGGTLNCGSCVLSTQSCVQNQCVTGASTEDAGSDGGGGLVLPDAGHSTPDSGIHATDASTAEDSGVESGNTGSSGGCGCKTAESTSTSTPTLAGVGGVLLLAGARLRRRRR